MQSEIKIKDDFWRDDLDDREVMVTIRCITYDHESYIRDALEGFVNQKTNFRFEAIVHDDASTDGTAAIIREYAEKYPSIIKPIFETENQYSKHDGSISRIMAAHIRGKYVAMCEGDDYWTDPLKLQKQVDFMESHPEYSMCFHNTYVFNQTHIPFAMPRIYDKDYSAENLYLKWTVPTASMLFKHDVLQQNYDSRLINGDIFLVLSCASKGKIRGLSDAMSVYRYTDTGITNKRYTTEGKENHLIKYLPHYDFLEEFFPDILSTEVKFPVRAWVYKSLLDLYFSNGDIGKANKLMLSIAKRHKRIHFLRFYLNEIFKRLIL